MMNSIWWPWALFLTGLLVSLIATPLVVRLAHKFQFLSPIDFRRKQKKQIPLLGGLAIFLSAAVGTVLVNDSAMYVVFMCSLPVFLVGVFDDKLELSSRSKGLVHLGAVALWLFMVPQDSLWMLNLGVPKVLAMGFMAFWIVGLINAMNMIDGMDTEAGGVSFIAAITMAVVYSGPSSLVMLAVAGGILGFLWFNKFPAQIYLGDSGSNFLGFYLAAASLSLPLTNLSLNSVLIPLFIFAVPEIDAILSMLRRAKNSHSIFGADHDHIHHKLQKIGLNRLHAALVIHGVSIYAGATAYLNFVITDTSVLTVVNVLCVSAMVFVLCAIFYIELAQAKRVSHASRTLLASHLDLDSDLKIYHNEYSAVVYDLLPYYKDMQLRGIGELNDFVLQFSDYIKEQHEGYHLLQVGSYTIIAVGSTEYSDFSSQNDLITNYYQLLKDFSLVKSESKVPWGMSFHSSQTKGDSFIKKFGLSIETDVVVKLKKTA